MAELIQVTLGGMKRTLERGGIDALCTTAHWTYASWRLTEGWQNEWRT